MLAKATLTSIFVLQVFVLLASSSFPHDSLSSARDRILFTSAEYDFLDLNFATDEGQFPSCDSTQAHKDLFEQFTTPITGFDSVEIDILLNNISDSLNLYMEVYSSSSVLLPCYQIGHTDQLVGLTLPADSSTYFVRYFTLSPDSISNRTFETTYKCDECIQRCPLNTSEVRNQTFIDSFAMNFPYCDIYTGDLILEDRPGDQIDNLMGLSDIIEIEGNLQIGSCQNLRNLKGLEQLTSISKTLSISWSSLTSIQDLSGLQYVKSLVMYGNNSLVDSVYLPSLTEISGRATIYSNANLQNLKMFSHVESIGQSAVISWNASLESLDGMENIENIEGDLLIEYNSNLLTDIDGLSSLRYVGNNFVLSQVQGIDDLISLSALEQVEGNFYIGSIYDLESLNGLQGLSSLGNNFTITDNPKLQILEGLNNLTHIDGKLLIENNSVLADLDGLSNLQSLDNFLHIKNNPMLWSIDGLQQLDPETIVSTSPSNKDLIIEGNYALSICDIDLICDLLDLPNVNYTIRSNGTRCSTVQEVRDDCANSILPIELLAFSANELEGSVHLNWSTSFEVNNKGFYLERSNDLNSWTSIAWIDGQNHAHQYSFIDKEPRGGLNYYRLKQEDFDRRFNISEVVQIEIEKSLTFAYPNPVKDLLYFGNKGESYQYFLQDVSGQIITSGKGSMADLSTLTKGLYFLHYNNKVEKVLKL